MNATSKRLTRLAIASGGSAAALAFGIALAPMPALAAVPAFSCTDHSGGVAGTQATMTSIRFAHHDGYDRIIFGFANSFHLPSYRLTQQTGATFIRDASGSPRTLQGTAGLATHFAGTDTTPGLLTDANAALPVIREVAATGQFERVTSYGIGLSGPSCFRILELSSPSRLVIDFAVPAVPSTPVAVPVSPAAVAVAAANPTPVASTAATTQAPRVQPMAVHNAAAAAPVSHGRELLLVAAGVALVVIAGAVLARRMIARR